MTTVAQRAKFNFILFWYQEMDEQTETALLLSKIKAVCYQGDGMESISLERWDEMTVEELRTVVILLDDGILDLIRAQGSMRVPCFFIKSLFEYISASDNAIHPFTRAPITALQRQHIISAYFRLYPDEYRRFQPPSLSTSYVTSTPAAIQQYRRDFGDMPPNMSYADRRIWELRREAMIIYRLIPEQVAYHTNRANVLRQRGDFAGATALMDLAQRVREQMQVDADTLYEVARRAEVRERQHGANRLLLQQSAVSSTGTIGPGGEDAGTGVEEGYCTIM